MNLAMGTKKIGLIVRQWDDSMQTLHDICKNRNYIATKSDAMPATKAQ